MGCWFCGNPLIWNNDFSYEDYGLEGEGIIAVLSCSNKDCGAVFEGALDLEKREEV